MREYKVFKKYYRWYNKEICAEYILKYLWIDILQTILHLRKEYKWKPYKEECWYMWDCYKETKSFDSYWDAGRYRKLISIQIPEEEMCDK